jgi:hypothetical protein
VKQSVGGAASGRDASAKSPIQTSDPFNLILSRAEGVKRLGNDRAIFKAPTREDRTPSVSLARGTNGTVLLHDFGGDSAADILAAFGLTLAALYPARERREMTAAERETLRQHGKMAGWAAALGVLDYESCIVAIAATDAADGRALDADDLERVRLACKRITDARAVLCPQPLFRPVQS